LTVDTDAPTVYAAYTEAGFDDIAFSSGSQSLFVDLDATGSSFAFEDVEMDFSSAGLTGENVDGCWDNGSYWTCVWNFTLSSSVSSRTTTLTIEATDDAGNAMESYDVDVRIDTDDPVITSVTKNLDCPTGSDTFEVVVNATDSTSDTLYVYFYGDDVRTDDEPIVEECVAYETGAFTCTLYVDDLVSYPENEDVKIEVQDIAGNIAEDELDVDVCELESAGTPDFVTVSVDDPAPLDMLTLSYIDVPVYVGLDFNLVSGAAIVSKSATCDEGSAYFIDTSSTESLMVLTLDQQTLPNKTTEIDVECTLALTMQYGDKVYATPETEEIQVDIDVYGTPLGSLEAGLQEKINYQIQGIQEAEEKINNRVKLNRILGTMCKIADTITKFNAIFAGVQIVVTTLATTVGQVIPAVKAFGIAFNDFAINIDGIILQWVWQPGVTGFGSVGAVVKYACILYTGKLCEGYNVITNDILFDGTEFGGPKYYTDQQDVALDHELFVDWDPYKSIHTAKSCLYIDAYIYNLRKERQINCMYTTCLQENAENGLTAEVCEAQFEERECLYVDSAAWLAANSPNRGEHFVQNILSTAFANLDIFAGTAAYYWRCSVYDIVTRNAPGVYAVDYLLSPYLPGGGLGSMVGNTFCQAGATTLTLTERGWFTENMDFNFKAELEGTDYCAAYGVSDTGSYSG
jgi:hypothetical protein